MSNQQKPTKEHIPDDKAELYRKAFDIARNQPYIKETDTAIFERVKESLGKDVTKQIEGFNTYNKCILLIGGDYDLVSGVVSYIWYTHPVSANVRKYTIPALDISVKSGGYVYTGEVQIEWRALEYKDYIGQVEDDIKVSSPQEVVKGHVWRYEETDLHRLKSHYENGNISFLRDVNSEYVNMLKLIAGVVRNAKPYKENIGYFTKPRGSTSRIEAMQEVIPGVLIVSTDKIPDLSEDFLRHFEIIKMGGDITGILSFNRLTGEFSFNGKNSKPISKESRANVRDTAKKLMRYWQKSKPCPQSELASEKPLQKHHLQSIYNDTSKIRKALQTIGVNLQQASKDSYCPPNEPQGFLIRD